MNALGEQNGPIDYFIGQTGIQLKSTMNANPNNFSQFKNNTVKPGLNQLKNAIDNGYNGNSFNDGQLYIMIPESLQGGAAQLKDYVDDWLANPNASDALPFQGYDFTILIGVFND